MPALARPTLYSFRRCPYAMRARLALQVTQSPCHLREVLLRDKPQTMLTASPKGTVPILLCLDGTVIEESLEIMLWCLRDRDPQGWLALDEVGSEDAHALIAECDGEFKQHLDRYKYSDRYSEEETSADHRELASVFLRGLDKRLSAGPWLLGDTLSLADVALAPFIRQFANTDRSWFDGQAWPALLAWLEDFLASPLFVSVMRKYQPWHPGDDEIRFPEDTVSTWSRS
jgi:glutathione S-transferase